MKKHKRTLTGAAICLGPAMTFMFLALLLLNTMQAQTSELAKARTIKAGRPLYDAALLLETLYAKPITYEDPILSWSGDFEPSRVGAKGLYPKEREFSLSAVLNPTLTPVLDAALLGNALAAYQQQTDGPHFQVSTSRWGLHFVPTEVRDETGRFVTSVSLLDYRISVPVSNRMPSEHFRAICDAVTYSSGIKVIAGAHWMDQFFAPNGIVPHRLVSDEEKRQISFAWGVTGVIAREAVIDLLEHSSTTMTWHVLCQVGEGECVFNLGPMQVTVMGPDGKPEKKSLTYDRCKECPVYLK